MLANFKLSSGLLCFPRALIVDINSSVSDSARKKAVTFGQKLWKYEQNSPMRAPRQSRVSALPVNTTTKGPSSSLSELRTSGTKKRGASPFVRVPDREKKSHSIRYTLLLEGHSAVRIVLGAFFVVGIIAIKSLAGLEKLACLLQCLLECLLNKRTKSAHTSK